MDSSVATNNMTTTEQAAKEELAILLRPVFDLLWSTDTCCSNDDDQDDDAKNGIGIDPFTNYKENMEDLWVDFFWSRDVSCLQDLGLFDAEHFRIMGNVYQEYGPSRFEILDMDCLKTRNMVSKLSTICLFIHHFTAKELLAILGQEKDKGNNKANAEIIWNEIQRNINTTCYPFDERSQNYANARSELSYLFSMQKPDEMLFHPLVRQDWLNCYGLKALYTLEEYPLLAGEPCKPLWSFYPFTYFVWSGFSRDILEQVYRLFPKVMNYVEEQGSIIQLLENMPRDEHLQSLPLPTFQFLLGIHPPPHPYYDSPLTFEPDLKISMFEILFQYYSHELKELYVANRNNNGRVVEVVVIDSQANYHRCTCFRYPESAECLEYIFDRISKLPQLKTLQVLPAANNNNHHPSSYWFPFLQIAVGKLSCLETFQLDCSSSTSTRHLQPTSDITPLLVALLQTPNMLQNLVVIGSSQQGQSSFYKIRVGDELCKALKSNTTLKILQWNLVSLEGDGIISNSILQAIQQSHNSNILQVSIHNDVSTVYFSHGVAESRLVLHPGYNYENYTNAECMRYQCSMHVLPWHGAAESRFDLHPGYNYENYTNAEFMRYQCSMHVLPWNYLQSQDFSPASVVNVLDHVQHHFNKAIIYHGFISSLSRMSRQPDAETQIYEYLQRNIHLDWASYSKLGTACLGVIFGLLQQSSSLWRYRPENSLKRKRDLISL